MLRIILDATLATLGIFTGVLLGLAIIAGGLLAVHSLYQASRYSRPAWWLHRHRPTRRGQ